MSKQYNFIYQHHNGALVYESEDGEKYVKFDDLPFETIGAVNEYKEVNRVRLAKQQIAAERKQERIEKSKESHNQLSNEDWKMLKGE